MSKKHHGYLKGLHLEPQCPLQELDLQTGLETTRGAEGAPKKTKGDEIRHLSTVRGRTYRYTTLSIQKMIGKGGGFKKP